MKNIYFVQVGFAFDRSVYLPYATGCLAAYALGKDDFKAAYTVKGFIYKREKLQTVLEKIDEPAVAAFSNYAWNVEFNKQLSQLIKEKYPECKIVFGGHSVKNDSADLLEQCPWIDYLTFGEGEETFYNLMMCLHNGTEPGGVKNIAYRSGEKCVCTPRSACPDISAFPSPYLTGIFDEIVRTEQEELLTVIETNRGCPYKCAYCDWSAKSRVRFFPMEKIKGELKWLSDNKIEYCFCADANFGMFKRDVEITKYAVELKKNTGFPDVFRPCYAKENEDTVFEICSEFNKVHMDKGATMAYQSLCPDALENIHRKNLTMEHFAGIVSRYNRAKIPTYSELILGLPGETYDSFCDGLCKLLEAGQHNSVSVYHCEILPNAIMGGEEYIKKYAIDSKRVKFNHIHSAQVDDEVTEYSQIVMGTYSMSAEMWVKSNLFSVCLQCFHSLGLLRCFAIYCHCELGMSYRRFYDSLFDFAMSKPDSVFGRVLHSYSDKMTNSLEGDWNYFNPVFGNVVWFFEEGMFLECLSGGGTFWQEIMPFLRSLKIDGEVFEQLLAYQQAVLRHPSSKGGEVSLSYDFTGYFDKILAGGYAPLEKVENKVTFFEPQAWDDWFSFAKNVVWFGRRKGATLYTSDREMYKVETE